MSCSVSGYADMYGLGIRTGFYLQWFGSIFADWVGAKAEALGLRFTNAFFVSATFLALLIQVSLNTLTALDIYIVLLLTFGGYYYLVPLYIWRLLTGCDPFLDPTRWPRVKMSRPFSRLMFMLLVVVAAFQMWFWCTGINAVSASGLPNGCQQYGFFLAMVPLNNIGFVVVNIFLNLGLLLVCFALLCLNLKVARPPRYLREKIRESKREQPNEERKNALQHLGTLIRLSVASIIVAATELTIQWNSVTGVNDVSTAGQTIPFAIGAGAFLRVLYVAFIKEDKGNNNDSDSDSSDPESLFSLPTVMPPEPLDPFFMPLAHGPPRPAAPRPASIDRFPAMPIENPDREPRRGEGAQRPRAHRSRSRRRR